MDGLSTASRTGTRARRLFGTPAELGALAALVLACATLVSLLGWYAPVLPLFVAGENVADTALYAGFHGIEHQAGDTYRWTSGSALVQQRGAYYAAPVYLAEMRLRAGNPSGPQPLTLLAGGHPVATVVPETRFRTYRLLLPNAGLEGGELWFGLQTPTFLPLGDPRPLGVMLTDLSLKPMAGLDLLAGGAAALALLGLWAALRALGVEQSSRLGLAALAGLGLVALVGLKRPPVAPHLLIGGLILVGMVAAGLLAHRLATRLGLAALTLIVALSGRLWSPWLSDDAFISFRYAQNLAQGHGLVYNYGERVEGYTNFLWTMLAALVVTLGGDLAVWSHVAGVALGSAIVLGTYWFGTRLTGEAWGLLAALIVGTSQSFLLYTGRGSGLETGLFTLLLLAASERYLSAGSQRFVAAGLLLALSALTRPEGVLVFGLTAAHLLLTLVARASGRRIGESSAAQTMNWRSLVLLCGAFLAVFLPYFLWRLWYYGDLLPNTFYAKTGGGLSQMLRGLEYAGGFAMTLYGPLLLILIVPWVMGWSAALRSWRGYLLPISLAYTGYIIAVGGDHFHGERFFVPLLPWLAISLADAIRSVYLLVEQGSAKRQGSTQSFIARVGLAVVVGVGGLAALARTAPLERTIAGLDESVWIWREIGWWMADHAAPQASLAAAGAGAVAYYGQHETIDLYGLTERHIGRMTMVGMGEGVAGHEKRDPTYVLTVRQPTYIPRLWDEYFGGAPALNQHYRLIKVTTRSGRELELWERQP